MLHKSKVVYHCEITPTDSLKCYITNSEIQGKPLFAVEATTASAGGDIIVLLNYEKAQELIDQLSGFMVRGKGVHY